MLAHCDDLGHRLLRALLGVPKKGNKKFQGHSLRICQANRRLALCNQRCVSINFQLQKFAQIVGMQILLTDIEGWPVSAMFTEMQKAADIADMSVPFLPRQC